MKYYFRVMSNLPIIRSADSKNPFRDSRDIEIALSQLQDEGWEFVGFGQKTWSNHGLNQEWWIFRRPKK